MSSTAHIQPLPAGSSLIRVYDCDDAARAFQDRQPYVVCVVAVPIGEGVIELTGLDKPLTRNAYRAIRRVLRDAGYLRAVIERRGRIIDKRNER